MRLLGMFGAAPCLWMLIAGCYPSMPIRTLSPKGQPSSPRASGLTLLGYYDIGLWGVAEDSGTDGWFEVEVEFIRSVPKDTPLNSVPILSMDSICFEAICIQERRCFVPLTSREAYKRWQRDHEGEYSFEMRFDMFPPDLMWDDKAIHPGNFEIGKQPLLPLSCREDTVYVVLYARINDRATGSLIRSETKRVPLLVKKDKSVLWR